MFKTPVVWSDVIKFNYYIEDQSSNIMFKMFNFKMERKTSRKLSTDMHRKLSAISTCSNVSDISLRLGMDPNDFKSTIQNILGMANYGNDNQTMIIGNDFCYHSIDLDVGDAWELESEDGLSCYGDESGFDDVPNDTITVQSYVLINAQGATCD
eukprot:TCALIF_03473-PA protein Name:"Protein of unknown function" AED:0.55 eAED:0.74 QI:0/0/0/0.33/0.5/0.33/3/0/153